VGECDLTKRFSRRSDPPTSKGRLPLRMKKVDSLKETKLSSIECFYSSLADRSVESRNYDLAQKV
jgi:hypothetical protein